jgi:AcrR family transcriptional regulator
MKTPSAVKDRIVDVATRLFYEQGYNLTGINQVIEEADIARGSLYNHFDSKTDLLLEYLNKFQEDWYIALEEWLKSINDSKTKIVALFDFRINSQQKSGFGGCPFVKINSEVSREDERVIKIVQENKEKLKAYILNLVQAARHKQIFSDTDLTEMIYLMMEGGVTSAAIYKHTKDLQSAKRIVSQLL